MPSFTRIPVDKSEGKIKSIGCLSLSSFAVLSGSFVEVWDFINNTFKVAYKFKLAPMNGMVCHSTCLDGRIFTFDSKRVYLLENGIILFIEQSGVSGIVVSYIGSFVAISSHSMEMFPVWTSKSVEVLAEKGSELDFINRKDVYLNVFISLNINLSQPVQVSAIPAQYTQSCGLQLDAHDESHHEINS